MSQPRSLTADDTAGHAYFAYHAMRWSTSRVLAILDELAPALAVAAMKRAAATREWRIRAVRSAAIE